MNEDKLQVLLNNEVKLEYSRETKLPSHQETYLEDMDIEMDKGISIGEDIIKSPGMLERSQHVTHTMINALLKENLDEANAMCAYLATRVADLAQVNCEAPENGKGISIKLIYKQNKPS